MNTPKVGFLVLAMAMAVAAVMASRSHRNSPGFCGPACLLPPAKPSLETAGGGSTTTGVAGESASRGRAERNP
ncbi:MAG: hypothetical protein JNK85_01630 [Verrucomicrobiales bacterium]|nr:hypothetical protein [Verrucomicrobiales bacterium]